MFVNISEVEVTSSQWTIGPLSLLTRCGGIIGVGKNLLWIIIVILSYIATVHTKIYKT